MTPFPYSVEPGATLEQAQEMMRVHDIHHLPVCENHAVIGILSERDTRVALSVDAEPPTVGEVCKREPYSVQLDAPLDEVADYMADNHIGSALVMRGDKLAGILTITDVCRLLARVLRKYYVGDDDDVA